jgi:hypothetical protein
VAAESSEPESASEGAESEPADSQQDRQPAPGGGGRAGPPGVGRGWAWWRRVGRDEAAEKRVKDPRRWRTRARVAVFALAGALLAVALAGRVTAKVGPFDTTVAVRPSLSGETLLRLPPLGTIGLDTHDWPLGLELRVDELGVDEAERLAENPELVDRLGDGLADQVQDALRRLALRSALVALAGGVAGALVARLSWRSAAGGLALGGLMVASVGAGTAATFNAEAVAEPRYSGLLTAAPTAGGDKERLVDRFDQ